MSSDFPKGLGASPHQRMMFWVPKTKVLEPKKRPCICMLPKNPNFDCLDSPTSNGHNSLNLRTY